MPSLEEGSPLVTYLALGAGLPVIVSEMGGGGIITHGREGMIIDPKDQDQFVKALTLLYNDTKMREKMAKSSKKLSSFYTWDKVASRRKKLLFEKIKWNKF